MGKEVRAHSEMPVHSRIEFEFGSVALRRGENWSIREKHLGAG